MKLFAVFPQRILSGLLLLIVMSAAAASAETDLADDELYVANGAVTSFDTCLAVADDHRATRLWKKDQDIAAIKEPDGRDLAVRLNGLQKQVRLRLGFGTLYTCAKIAETWSSLGRDERMNGLRDGRRRHGTMVIDLGMGERRYRGARSDETGSAIVEDRGVLRGSIEAVPLVRILTSSNLLPRRDFGGIVIRNAEIDGTLLFYNVDLDLPLAFANVRFRGHHYPREVFGDENDPPVVDTAIAIVNARVNDSMEFVASEICGTVRLAGSRFADTVSFRRTHQYGINCDPETKETAAPEFAALTSVFEQKLSADRVDFGSLHLVGSQVQSLAFTHSRFGARFEITENSIGSLQINCSLLATKADIARNQIDRQLLLEGIDTVRNRQGEVQDTACNDWWRASGWYRPEAPTRLTIDDNRIGGRLYIDLLQGSDVKESIGLTNNSVAGRSRVVMPSAYSDGGFWAGNISFNGSTYDGNLEIRHAAKETDSPVASLPHCDTLSDTGAASWATLSFNVTHIRTLIWNLPLSCGYRWLGHGLTYDLWLSGDFAKHSLLDAVATKDKVDLDHMALMTWRMGLTRNDPSPLNILSQYLSSKGQYVESRRVLYEAKRLNYAPTCRPDHPIWACLGGMLAGRFDGRALAAEPDGQADVDASRPAAETQSRGTIMAWIDDATAWLTRFGLLLLLWPGGYGASPEFALVLLLALFAACWPVYGFYVRGMRRKLAQEWSYIHGFMRENEGLIVEPKAAPKDRSGLDDVRAVFDLEQGPMAEADAVWISRKTWIEDMTDKNRLLEIQGPLLARVQAWEAGASGPDLKIFQDFRQRLARFGNTEIVGFDRFDRSKMPKRFTPGFYAFDTMLPVIDLHAYSNYYPIAGWARALSAAQHVIGWWLVSVFIASAAIL